MDPDRRKRRGRVVILACLLLLAGFLQAGTAEAAVYKQGSSGEEVKTIQAKLKQWGYYAGQADGIYGPKTEAAVKWFQEKNGLTADGIAGPETLKSMGISAGGNAGAGGAEENNMALLAKIISAEARGEPFNGQVAVGAVIMNRVEHPSFPNTIYGVIYQPGAFSCLQDGQVDQPVADSAYRAAREAMNGSDPSGGAIYYFNPDTATSAWIWSRPLLAVIGKHRFCA
jgi:N-acetylmuramoyl-L-alanine amidase